MIKELKKRKCEQCIISKQDIHRKIPAATSLHWRMQIPFVYAFITVISAVAQHSLAIRCYICGPGSQQPFKNTKSVGGFNDARVNSSGHATTVNNGLFTSCQDFEKKHDFLEEFIMECPSQYSGCITEFEGNRTTRTCESLDINDCQIANKITYCYCNTDLCNSKSESLLAETHRNFNNRLDNSDDEDLTESSGMDESNSKRKNHMKTIIDGKSGTMSSGWIKGQNPLLYILISICLIIHKYSNIPNSIEYNMNGIGSISILY